jgi:hypothetical protein
LENIVTYSLQDVLSKRFEARCVGPDGARYLWHRDCGLRVDTLTKQTTLITDPAALPEGMWYATVLGLKQLREEEERSASAG